MTSRLLPTPELDDTLTWRPRDGGAPMREITDLHRDSIFADFFAALEAFEPRVP